MIFTLDRGGLSLCIVGAPVYMSFYTLLISPSVVQHFACILYMQHSYQIFVETIKSFPSECNVISTISCLNKLHLCC